MDPLMAFQQRGEQTILPNLFPSSPASKHLCTQIAFFKPKTLGSLEEPSGNPLQLENRALQ